MPTLDDLLKPVDQRPEKFFAGDDVYDQQRVGFVTNRPDNAAGTSKASRKFSEFDTKLRGNSNKGHVYGSGLSDEDRRALLEYLKTL